jgi:ribosomal-protein-alanine N-acetyltransferase
MHNTEPGAELATVIETSRFILREYRAGDRDAFIAYQTDPRFTLYHSEDELGEAQAAAVFGLFLAWQTEPRLNYQLAIERRADGALVGSCGVRMEGCAPGEAVFGIELARDCWGRFGYATETARALVDWAFTHLRLDALVADTAHDNAAVARLAKWAGFEQDRLAEKQWWRLSRSAWIARNQAQQA